MNDVNQRRDVISYRSTRAATPTLQPSSCCTVQLDDGCNVGVIEFKLRNKTASTFVRRGTWRYLPVQVSCTSQVS